MSLASLEGLAERNRDGILLLSRVLLAAIFVQSGFGKLTGFEGFASAMAAKGLPLPTLWAIAAVAAEFGGSLLILL
ncbi:MAG TPA: DoxX family protein, partial [Dongiaceae bacterium]|nr:DoxX family protein [Dongiaceae bacterium]